MMLEYLQPDPNLWDGITVVVRAAYYAASLGAAGLVFFLVLLGHTLADEERRRVSRWLAAFVVAALAAGLLAWPVRVAVLSRDGFEGMMRWDLYAPIGRSRIGDAFFLRVGGLLLCLAALSRKQWALPVAAIGAFVVCASYAAMGHSTLYRPRQELSVFTTAHLVAVAFWIGSLIPLRIVCERSDNASVASVMDAFSKVAIGAVALLAAIGAVAAIYLIGRWDLLAASWYGWAFVAKVTVFLVLLSIAAWNKLRLTPAIRDGVPGASERLRFAIGVEIWVALLVFYAAAEMVSVHPLDYGHRIPS